MSQETITEIFSHELPATPWNPEKQAIEEAKIQVAMIGFCGLLSTSTTGARFMLIPTLFSSEPIA